MPWTTDTQWRHKSKISKILGQCGRQNMLWPKDLGVRVNFQPCSAWRLFPLWVSIVCASCNLFILTSSCFENCFIVGILIFIIFDYFVLFRSNVSTKNWVQIFVGSKICLHQIVIFWAIYSMAENSTTELLSIVGHMKRSIHCQNSIKRSVTHDKYMCWLPCALYYAGLLEPMGQGVGGQIILSYSN